MKVLITSGGTSEYIDDVRVLTNISSGKLGSKIAEAFYKSGCDVQYIHGKGAILPEFPGSYNSCECVKGVDRLIETLEKNVPTADVIIHAMAVSDFGFKRDGNIKLKSNNPQAFIDYMRDTIKINPKVISLIKKWNPDIKLVGFKFEVGITNKNLIELARKSITKNKCELVVANDKVEMATNKKHIAYLVTKENSVRVEGKEEIANSLVEAIKEIYEK